MVSRGQGVRRNPQVSLETQTPQESGFDVHLAIFRSHLFPQQNLSKILNSSPSLFGTKTLACVPLSSVQTNNDASANCDGLSYYGTRMKQ